MYFMRDGELTNPLEIKRKLPAASYIMPNQNHKFHSKIQVSKAIALGIIVLDFLSFTAYYYADPPYATNNKLLGVYCLT